ncbi:MAG: winged helix-turn-helix domain-containing protein [archaeon]
MVTRETTRRLMIEKQGLHLNQNNPGKEQVYETIEKLGCLQIDTINVVERAHYLTLWSRLGNYRKKNLDSLTYEDRKLFEYWAHAASYIPIKHYRYYIHAMNERKKELLTRLKKRTGKGRELVNRVLNRIKKEGALSSSDFKSKKKGKSGWWNRKNEKVAMDYLYGAGVLSVSNRVNFQKYYDLTENVIPASIDKTSPSEEERVWFFIEKTMDCLGVIQPSDAREYYQNKSVRLGKTSSQIEEIIREKDTVNIELEGDLSYYCLPEDASRLEEIDDDFDHDRVNMLVYFDNFMWNRQRIQELFQFEPKLEIYLPKEERVYGYYHLSVLHGDQIVARIEPKMDRSENKLIIRGYWTEEGFKETEDYRDKLEKKLETFAAFHKAEHIEWLS